MPASCCIVDCYRRHSASEGIKTYPIPADPVRRNLWKNAVKRAKPWDFRYHNRVCDKHFVNGKPCDDPLHVDHVPTLHLGYSKKSPKGSQKRYERQKARHGPVLLNITNTDTECSFADASCEIETGIGVQTDPITKHLVERRTQTELKGSQIGGNENQSEVTGLKQQIMELSNIANHLQSENLNLKIKMDEKEAEVESVKRTETVYYEVLNNRCTGHVFIVGNDQRTKFYTGLPSYKVFHMLCENLSAHVSKLNTKLSHFEELLMILMKLRLNLTTQDLAYRFGMSTSSVSAQFHKWLDVMYEQLGGLVMWPSTDRMQLPEAFQTPTYSRTKVIIDCFEIFIDRPTALKARAQTYSNYKSHNTAKILIGISPSGAVIFLSPTWGGRASDKKMTLDSGLLELLNPGDIVLADRGFTIQEEFAMRNVKVMVPAFTRGKKQLPAKDVEETRSLARVRIHVERVINRCRDYKILKGPIPITLVRRRSDKNITTLDKIVRVCCALTNLSPAVLTS